MRHALKRDSTHRSIADGLRAIGATVLEGFDVDCFVLFRGKSFLLECKPETARNKRKPGLRAGTLRTKQEALQAIFGSDQYKVCCSLDEALRAIGAVGVNDGH